MDPQIIMAIIGVGASILSFLSTWFILRKYFPERAILPTKIVEREIAEREPYRNLEGVWQQYHLTRDASVSPTPFWAHHEEHLRIRKGRFVEGSSINIGHPARLQYKIRGEIRYGKMILTYDCIQEPTEFSTDIYPDLLNRELLVGSWTGFDYQRNGVAGAAILSQECRSAKELNEILLTSGKWGYIQGDDYPLQPL